MARYLGAVPCPCRPQFWSWFWSFFKGNTKYEINKTNLPFLGTHFSLWTHIFRSPDECSKNFGGNGAWNWLNHCRQMVRKCLRLKKKTYNRIAGGIVWEESIIGCPRASRTTIQTVETDRCPNLSRSSVRLIEIGNSITICPSSSREENVKSFTKFICFLFLNLINEKPGAGRFPNPELVTGGLRKLGCSH